MSVNQQAVNVASSSIRNLMFNVSGRMLHHAEPVTGEQGQ